MCVCVYIYLQIQFFLLSIGSDEDFFKAKGLKSIFSSLG